mgnify:CR=1 FL=1
MKIHLKEWKLQKMNFSIVGNDDRKENLFDLKTNETPLNRPFITTEYLPFTSTKSGSGGVSVSASLWISNLTLS